MFCKASCLESAQSPGHFVGLREGLVGATLGGASCLSHKAPAVSLEESGGKHLPSDLLIYGFEA